MMQTLAKTLLFLCTSTSRAKPIIYLKSYKLTDRIESHFTTFFTSNESARLFVFQTAANAFSFYFK